ncbi:hypothetical protein PF002_g11281 [Phytophthora fragariae]|uniref:Uncharacterized protein n=1 Tax=Phytophthora fragariae TaxID=53985 RepID=A0A6A3ZGD3_9STRA|nr:hypothetical protein PF002_g11281 [Phytophthora fragariae]
MRNVLAENTGSTGLDVIDEVAKTLIEDTGLAAQALSGPETILPHLLRQAISTGPPLARPSPGPPRSDLQRPSRRRAAPPRSRGPVSSPAALEFVRDLESVYRHVAAEKLKPWQQAYPWEGEHLFYDPEEYPDIYLAHWRFWHVFREVFFEWA